MIGRCLCYCERPWILWACPFNLLARYYRHYFSAIKGLACGSLRLWRRGAHPLWNWLKTACLACISSGASYGNAKRVSSCVGPYDPAFPDVLERGTHPHRSDSLSYVLAGLYGQNLSSNRLPIHMDQCLASIRRTSTPSQILIAWLDQIGDSHAAQQFPMPCECVGEIVIIRVWRRLLRLCLAVYRVQCPALSRHRVSTLFMVVEITDMALPDNKPINSLSRYYKTAIMNAEHRPTAPTVLTAATHALNFTSQS